MSIVHHSKGAAVAPPTVAPTLELQSIGDPWERARAASRAADQLHDARRAALKIRLAAVRELVEGRRIPASVVGRFLGITGGRICQMLAGGRTNNSAATGSEVTR
ncbi:hypothetical protein [Micromonospora tarensis]|uniref:Sigma-70, region 4 n=1 Tax=Micromonospora tarensis TaxID=2806100 RepID=A0ABS1YNP5_9ACTN|nr:hypothetical protein [Micromonospora tarensis]MBM0279062.1 hypothetical protein [Micromonospora tarensis]